VIGGRFSLRPTFSAEVRTFWTSEAAKKEGSLNLAGISHPAIDALVEKVVAARSREEMLAAVHALDRVIRAGHYWVPNWYSGVKRVVYWDRYNRPEKTARYDRRIGIHTWWYDTAKAARLKSN
jgi:microcin C transport system substrate-binding protein